MDSGERMRLPKKINILGRTYKIERFDFDKALHCNNINGNCWDNKQTIQIDSTMHREKQEATLFHEIIHIISYNLSLELDEKVTCQLEAGLYQVLKDNKLLKDA